MMKLKAQIGTAIKLLPISPVYVECITCLCVRFD